MGDAAAMLPGMTEPAAPDPAAERRRAAHAGEMNRHIAELMRDHLRHAHRAQLARKDGNALEHAHEAYLALLSVHCAVEALMSPLIRDPDIQRVRQVLAQRVPT